MLAALVAVLGTGPFLEALRATDARALAAGLLIALLTTVCGAWRWRLVAGRLGAPLTLGGAVAACYRAQFLNATLPGGVVGDVGRGVSHGRSGGDLGRGLRGVVWERTAGQLVLAVLTGVALLVARPFDLPRLRATSTALVIALVVAAVVVLALGLARIRGRSGAAWLRVVSTDLRALWHGPASAGIVLASVVVVIGHLATFLLAARTVGVRTPVTVLVPLALVVLVMAAIPLNLAGWGPREGAAAWVFAAAGLGAGPGLATAVAFGAIVLVGTLPGAALLLTGRARRARSPVPVEAQPLVAPAGLDAVGGAARG